MKTSRRLLPLLALVCALAPPAPSRAQEEMRGHGGPVRALSVAADGSVAISGSFDSRAILWSLERGEALQVLRLHDSAVNAAIALSGGRFATAGQDGRVAIWSSGAAAPLRVLGPGGDGHDAPVVALALSPDGRALASASWDRTVRVWPLDREAPPLVLEGHDDNVNAVAFLGDGVISAAQDGGLRIFAPAGGPPRTLRFPAPLATLQVSRAGEIVVGGADGIVRILSAGGDPLGEVEAQPGPVIALALSPDGATIAAGGLRGAVVLIDRRSLRIDRRIDGPGLPVWSIAFTPDGREVLTGGADRLVRRWNAATGGHVGPILTPRARAAVDEMGEPRGARVFRACVACHALTPEDGPRAGPTLHGVFGRRIATAQDYDFSPALRGMDIVWNAESIARLFEIGPNAYTPGTKMPEQTIGDPEDRAALVRFLERATRPR
jgi:cytochrome c